MTLKLEENEEVDAEFHSHIGEIDYFLPNILTEYTLDGLFIHEELHRIIDEIVTTDGFETTEKQDHYIIQRLCF